MTEQPVPASGTPGVVSTSTTVLAAVLVTLGASLPVYVLGAMSVEVEHSLAFGAGTLGLAAGAYYFGAAASSIPLSRFAERVGGGRVMRVASAAEGVLLLLIATVARSWPALTVLLGLTGIAGGAVMPAVYLFLTRRVPEDRQGRAFGINQAAVPLAPLLGGLGVPLVALTVGWRWAFVMAAALALVAAAVVPKSLTTLTDRRLARRGRDLAPVRPLPIVALSVGIGLGMFAASGFLTFLATGAVHDGFTRAGAGYLVASAGAAAVVARIGIGIRADRRREGHFPAVAVMLTMGGVGYLLVALASAGRVHWLFVAAAVVAAGTGWGWNALFNLAVVRAHHHAPAKATGFTDVGARLGGVLGPVVAGQILRVAPYDVAWLAISLAAFGAAIAILLGSHQLAKGPVVSKSSA